MDAAELRTTVDMAMLDLSAEQTGRLQDAVDRIIEYFSIMAAVDVTGVEPTTHALGAQNRTRPDEVDVRVAPELLIENAPEAEDRLITIPNVL